MKKKLQFSIFICTIVFNVFAQDTLKVNIQRPEAPGAPGWDSIIVSDKAAYEDGAQYFDAFENTV